MKLQFPTLGLMGPIQVTGTAYELAPKGHGSDVRRCNRPAAGDRLLCIYLAQNPGLMRRHMEMS